MKLGEHYLTRLTGCDPSVISDKYRVESVIDAACEIAHAHKVEQTFEGYDAGVSGAIILEESHISVHTYPGQHLAMIDLFTCSETVNEEEAIEYIMDEFRAAGLPHECFRKIDRGMDTLHGLPESGMPGRYAHLLDDITGCHHAALDDIDAITWIFGKAAEAGGIEVIGNRFKRFEPQGASGLLLGRGSHITAHTWPEFGYMAFDFYTSRPNGREQGLLDVIYGYCSGKGSYPVWIGRESLR